MRSLLIITTALMFCALTTHAQTRRQTKLRQQPSFANTADTIVNRYLDSLRILSEETSLSLTHRADSDDKLLSNPYYYRLFVSPMLYRSPLKRSMDIGLGTHSDKNLQVGAALDDFFGTMYVKHPNMVDQTEVLLDNQTALPEDLNTQVEHKVQVSDNIKPKELETVVEPIEAISRKPNFWSISQSLSVNLQQYYYSDNWYQGGTNYNSALVTYRLYANYNNKQKVTFNNTLEIDIGFQSDKNDSIHKYKTNTDRIRLTNNLGVQAAGNWYYSALLQSWTQMFRKFSSNSHTVTSDFMSPFESTLSIGMKYEKNKNSNKLSVNIGPLAYNFKYVGRESLCSSNGTWDGHHTYESFGSNITTNWTLKILDELTWTGRLYYFTNYSKVQVEWENTFKFTIIKFLNTTLYLYPRFDDSYHSSKSDAVIQFKEYLTLGASISF